MKKFGGYPWGWEPSYHTILYSYTLEKSIIPNNLLYLLDLLCVRVVLKVSFFLISKLVGMFENPPLGR